MKHITTILKIVYGSLSLNLKNFKGNYLDRLSKIDNYLLICHPELWRRNYPRVIRTLFYYSIISIIFVTLICVNSRLSGGEYFSMRYAYHFGIYFALHLSICRALVYFQKRHDLSVSKYYFFDPHNEKIVLIFNLGFAIFSIIQSLILTLIPYLFFDATPDKIRYKSDLTQVMAGEFYLQKNANKTLDDTATLKLLCDSIGRNLDTNYYHKYRSVSEVSALINSTLEKKDTIYCILTYANILNIPTKFNIFDTTSQRIDSIISYKSNYQHITNSLNNIPNKSKQSYFFAKFVIFILLVIYSCILLTDMYFEETPLNISDRIDFIAIFIEKAFKYLMATIVIIILLPLTGYLIDILINRNGVAQQVEQHPIFEFIFTAEIIIIYYIVIGIFIILMASGAILLAVYLRYYLNKFPEYKHQILGSEFRPKNNG